MAKATIPGKRLAALVEFALDHVAEWEDHCSIYVEYLGVAKREEKGPLSLDRFYKEFQAILKLLIEEGQIEGQVRHHCRTAPGFIRWRRASWDLRGAEPQYGFAPGRCPKAYLLRFV